MTKTPLLVRPGTSDIAVFRQVYIERIYDVDCPVRPTLILDLGAYTGLSTRWLGDRYSHADVIAVEPHPEHWPLVEQNAPRAMLWRGAATGTSGPVELRQPPGGQQAATVRPDESPVVTVVEGWTVPEILDGRKPEVVKMDIEGSERDLFLGDTDWLASVRLLLIESHDRFVPGCTDALKEALKGRKATWAPRGGSNVAITLEKP